MPLADQANGFGGWSIAHRFYSLEASPKGSSLERFPMLSNIYIYTLLKPDVHDVSHSKGIATRAPSVKAI